VQWSPAPSRDRLVGRAGGRRRYLEDEEQEGGSGREVVEAVGEQLTGGRVGLRLAKDWHPTAGHVFGEGRQRGPGRV
jgi:hypothetical protein